MNYEKTFEDDKKVFPIEFDNETKTINQILNKIKELN